MTGGAGFIGSNLAERLLADPRLRVRIFDNFSRRGVQHNLNWLRLPERAAAGDRQGDVRDAGAVRRPPASERRSTIWPRRLRSRPPSKILPRDFEVNALGTFNVLEAARALRAESVPALHLDEQGVRLAGRVSGRSRRDALPCRSTAAFRRERARSRSISIRLTAVPRARQTSTFATTRASTTCPRWSSACPASPGRGSSATRTRAGSRTSSTPCLQGRPITIYGDGFQVRDILHVHDLLDAMMAARDAAQPHRGEIYNLGGGLERAVSVVEMLQRVRAPHRRSR